MKSTSTQKVQLQLWVGGIKKDQLSSDKDNSYTKKLRFKSCIKYE